MQHNFQYNKKRILQEIAKTIAPHLQKNTIIFLNGPLGIGKTQFTKYLGTALTIKSDISSPTFNIMNRYEIGPDFYLVHMDAYRLAENTTLSEFYEFIMNNILILEWSEKIDPVLFSSFPRITINFTFDHDVLEGRNIEITFQNFNNANETNILHDLYNLLKKTNT